MAVMHLEGFVAIIVFLPVLLGPFTIAHNVVCDYVELEAVKMPKAHGENLA